MKALVSWLSCGLLLLAGCSQLSVRSQSPEDLSDSLGVPLVGDRAVPFGMYPVCVETVGWVTGLSGTGSNPEPSPERQALVEDMQARGIGHPQSVLATRGGALVKLRGYLYPGIQKGDRFDLDVRVPGQSETTSLRGGWLLESRLTEMRLLEGSYHRGNLLALAEGPVMIDPSAEGKKDQVMLCRGRILGGGVCLKSRDLGFALRSEYQDVFNAARIAAAINKRFHTFDRGLQSGVAKAHNDKMISLRVHPRYKDNIARYLQVCRALPLYETDSQLADRLTQLRKDVLTAEKAGEASLQLEAIGAKRGVDPLLAALGSTDIEVRFYAAESLAYLDRREAAEPLGQIARDEPAFRAYALTALSAMDDYGAYEQLRQMLDLPSAETRYGAFRALWAMNPDDPLVKGEDLSDQFSYIALDTLGPPLVHVTHTRRAEIVLFGKEQRLTTPLAVNAGSQIMVTSQGPDEIAVSRFSTSEQDQKRLVSSKLDEVIRAIVELGGRYPDVVQALQEAKLAGALPSRFEVDCLPKGGRTYQRKADGAESSEGEANRAPATPKGELFELEGKKPSDEPDSEEADEKSSDAGGQKIRPFGGFFARMAGRDE